MIRATLMVPLLAFAVAGCDLLFPEDFREGDEAQEVCIGRVQADLTYERYNELQTASGEWIPFYTYDVTKLDFAAIKALSVEGTDETAGTRLMQETNSTSTAVERFKAMEVSEKGAFFLGREPALYRVRGKRQKASDILANGCARQQTNMRLIDLDWRRPGAQLTPDPSQTDAESGDEANETSR
jgi:hypothetical protein